ncbi:MAG TPA: hypothetical protein VKT81_03830 [Bryobacteraceae bacterium]|nr:hypothetical protein [Bryobacteraceae bacterium]
MKKFLVLYQSEAALTGRPVSEMFAQATPEQLKAGMQAWKNWHEKSGNSVVDLGAPLDNSTTLTRDSANSSKTTITGFSILQAASMDAAVALLKGHPHFSMPGASVQILECIPTPGV